MTKRILVVEDHEDNRQIVRDMLAPTDYEIIEVENGEEALAAIAKQRPDLILMDVQLPIMDGYHATRRIKADPALRSIPIIAVTTYALSGEDKGRERQAAMTTWRNHTARASCWRKFGSVCQTDGIFAAVPFVSCWPNSDPPLMSSFRSLSGEKRTSNEMAGELSGLRWLARWLSGRILSFNSIRG
jgi:two-component system cell cycle response regulator DivK